MNNNAPEKIYVHVRANKELGTTWHGKKITNSDIEYTRTDAFIEKALEWIDDNMLSSNQQDNSLLYYERFKKYMND